MVPEWSHGSRSRRTAAQPRRRVDVYARPSRAKSSPTNGCQAEQTNMIQAQPTAVLAEPVVKH